MCNMIRVTCAKNKTIPVSGESSDSLAIYKRTYHQHRRVNGTAYAAVQQRFPPWYCLGCGSLDNLLRARLSDSIRWVGRGTRWHNGGGSTTSGATPWQYRSFQVWSGFIRTRRRNRVHLQYTLRLMDMKREGLVAKGQLITSYGICRCLALHALEQVVRVRQFWQRPS